MHYLYHHPQYSGITHLISPLPPRTATLTTSPPRHVLTEGVDGLPDALVEEGVECPPPTEDTPQLCVDGWVKEGTSE